MDLLIIKPIKDKKKNSFYGHKSKTKCGQYSAA